MPRKKANNIPGLCPVKGQKLALTPGQGPEINSRADGWMDGFLLYNESGRNRKL
jgi:hypothetical protein